MDTLYSGTVTIRRPVMEVFDYAADIKHIPDWYPFYVRVEDVPKSASDTEQSFISYLTPLPWPSIRIDRTSCVPGRRLSYRSWDVGLMCDVEFFEAVPGETQLKATISPWAWPSMVVGLFIQPFRFIGNDSVNLFLRSLKERVEAAKADAPRKTATPAKTGASAKTGAPRKRGAPPKKASSSTRKSPG
jgi:hypothetical protein